MVRERWELVDVVYKDKGKKKWRVSIKEEEVVLLGR